MNGKEIFLNIHQTAGWIVKSEHRTNSVTDNEIAIDLLVRTAAQSLKLIADDELLPNGAHWDNLADRHSWQVLEIKAQSTNHRC